ncbi:MAG: DUF4389 domain-containing protein [Actinomycetota bacterium]
MYPVTYAADHAEEGRNRLTTFFRGIVSIPWLIVGSLYGFAASFAIFFAWFALVFTGRYPQGLYDFVAGYVRFISRVNGFAYLVTDEYPSFNGGPDDAYPIRIGITAPKPEYSRLKAGLRLIVGIPVMLLAWVQSLIGGVMALFSWFAILFTGRHPEGLFDPLRSALAYETRATAYFGLLTEDWPPFSLEEEGTPQLGTPAQSTPVSETTDTTTQP